jgi:hypothetical protein
MNNDSKKLRATLNEFLAKRLTQLHHSLNQVAYSSQNPLILSIILMIFFIGKISKLGHDLPATSSESN